MALILAAAQSASLPGDIPENVARHLHFATIAADHGVRLLVFPELSLTGYELGLAQAHAIRPDDAALTPLRDQAMRSKMTIVAGAPMPSDTGESLYIAGFAYRPDGSVEVYAKQHVHSSEAHVFTAGAGGSTIFIENTAIALAICFDAANPSHAAAAAAGGAGVYAVGAMLDAPGYQRKTALCQNYAREHRMVVLLANYSGETGGEVSEGKSTIWSEDGEILAASEGGEEALVIASRQDADSAWSGFVVPITLPGL